jgi:hypothetical protein
MRAGLPPASFSFEEKLPAPSRGSFAYGFKIAISFAKVVTSRPAARPRLAQNLGPNKGSDRPRLSLSLTRRYGRALTNTRADLDIAASLTVVRHSIFVPTLRALLARDVRG